MIAQLTRPLYFSVILPFLILIVAGLTIPSDGSHGILNIKSLAFITTVIGATAYLTISKKFTLPQLRVFLFVFIAFTFFVAWIAVSLLRDDSLMSSTLDQLKIFILTITVVVLSAYYTSEKLLSFQQLLKTILLANFCYSLMKISLLAFHLLGLINMWSVLEKTGIRFMSMDIVGGIPRIQTSIDIATPFLLFFFLLSSSFGIRWSKKFRTFYILISIIAMFLSFSRYLIAVGVLSTILYGITLQFTSIMRAAILMFIAMTISISIIGTDTVYTIVERRLFSKDNYHSDRTRVEQINSLLDEHETYPWLGKGLGGYTKHSIRDSKILHSYEVQWIAFLMQFGVIGLFLLIIPAIIIILKILLPPISTAKIGLFFLFLSWLFAGFTNPFLISLTSGILYALFLLTPEALNLETVQGDKVSQNG